MSPQNLRMSYATQLWHLNSVNCMDEGPYQLKTRANDKNTLQKNKF